MNESMPNEPTRLLDDPDVEALLRNDLLAARDHAGVPYAVDAGLARFEAAVAGAATVPTGGSLAGLRVLRWFGGAAVGAGALALWLLAGGDPRSPQAEPAVAAAADQATPAGTASGSTDDAHRGQQASPDPTSPTTADAAVAAGPVPGPVAGDMPATSGDDDEAQPEDASSHDTSRDLATQRPSPKPAPDEVAPALDEVALINAARKALAADPARTLALTETAETSFPDGALIEERRGYAILALVALDRRDEAQRRAASYLERWPKGSLARRVRAAVESPAQD